MFRFIGFEHRPQYGFKTRFIGACTVGNWVSNSTAQAAAEGSGRNISLDKVQLLLVVNLQHQ